MIHYLFKLCTKRVKVAMGMRPLGFLDRRSASCHVTCPALEERSLHVFSTEYKSLSRRPVDQEEKMLRQQKTVKQISGLTTTFLSIFQHPLYCVSCQFNQSSPPQSLKTKTYIKHLTGGADSECCQGPAESQHASVLRAESVQAVLHQLAQRLRQVLKTILQLRYKSTL